VPLTSLLKVPSGFLAAKMVVCERMLCVLAAAPGPTRSPVPPDVLTVETNVGVSNSLLVHYGVRGRRTLPFSYSDRLAGSMRSTLTFSNSLRSYENKIVQQNVNGFSVKKKDKNEEKSAFHHQSSVINYIFIFSFE